MLGRLAGLIQPIEMLATLCADLLAGHGSDRRPRIHDEVLGVLVRPHIHLGVEVLQAGRVAFQLHLLQV